MLAVFGEFEREMIVARVNAGLARARQRGTRSGKAIGRPKGADYDRKAIRSALLNGRSVRQVAKATERVSGRQPRCVRSSSRRAQ